jgi:DNA-binding transcriptional ArsR family regulator
MNEPYPILCIWIMIFWYQLAYKLVTTNLKRRRIPMNWQLLARANTHPLRISILEILAMDGGRTLSPSDLSYELRSPLSNVNYHVTELRRSGLVELAGERPVRGATEHFYREAKGVTAPLENGGSRNGRRRKRGAKGSQGTTRRRARAS